MPGNTINWGNTISILDFLSSGALLAIGIKHTDPKKITVFLWIGLGAFVIAFCTLTHKPFTSPIYLTSLHGQFFLLGVLLLATLTVLSLATQSNKITRRVFANNYAVYVGKISYGLYLYHYPFFLFIDSACHHFKWDWLQTGNYMYLLAIIKIAGSLIIAALSFRFFEKKILGFKERFKYVY
jgi:peptidoglycan/LPS O-acetylase OafA/YrhL